MAPKIMFGNHTAIAVLITPETANVVLTVLNRMKMALSAMPMPTCKPVPPRTLRDESDKPIIVRMNTLIGMENRLRNSSSNACMLPTPRDFCLRKYRYSSVVVICGASSLVRKKSSGSM